MDDKTHVFVVERLRFVEMSRGRLPRHLPFQKEGRREDGGIELATGSKGVGRGRRTGRRMELFKGTGFGEGELLSAERGGGGYDGAMPCRCRGMLESVTEHDGLRAPPTCRQLLPIAGTALTRIVSQTIALIFIPSFLVAHAVGHK
ncbi:hypothetical protein BHE74_00047246 [Ensete ventricosum]|nr:hypothetical protein BHE74_00047246 [Ensete ventricosum]